MLFYWKLERAKESNLEFRKIRRPKLRSNLEISQL